jgi:hypothetical protein
MRGLSEQEANRLRRLHLVAFLLPPIWLLLFLLAAAALPEPQSEFWLIAWAALFLVPIAAGLLGFVLIQRRVWKATASVGPKRWKIWGASWLLPFGSFIAVDRLLKEAVRKGQGS